MYVGWRAAGRDRDPRYAVVELTRDWIAHCTVGDFNAFKLADTCFSSPSPRRF